MRNAFRPILLSLMLGLLDAMRRAESPLASPFGHHWIMRAPMSTALVRPARCWFWEQSPTAN